MRRYSERPGLSTIAEINVTPLLDLAFVLLIIFMLLTPLLDKSSDLLLPTSETAATEVDPNLVRTISIDRFEKVMLDEDPIELSALEVRVRELREQGSAQAVLVRPHRELPVQRLVDIMDSLQRAGITRVGVLTSPPGEN